MKVLRTPAAVLAAILALCDARPAPSTHVLHEERLDMDGSSWVKAARIEDSLRVPAKISLTQSNLDKGGEILMDISHPASPNYGKHLSEEEVIDLFAPTQERVDTVTRWLKSSLKGDRNVTLSPNKQWVQFDASIAELQNLLYTDYYEYENLDSGRSVLGCNGYHLPKDVQEHVDYISPGVKTLALKKREASSSLRKRDYILGGGKLEPKMTPAPAFEPIAQDSSPDCGFAITPECIRILYNITDEVAGNPSNSIGVYETELEIYNQTDLDLLFKTFVPNIPAGTAPTFEGIDGAPPVSNASFTGGEADLDFEAVYPLVYPDEVVFYNVDDYYYQTKGAVNISGIFNTFLDGIDGSYCTYSAFNETGDDPAIDATYPDPNPGGFDQPEQCGVYAPTNVISISYSIDEDRLPLNYQLRQCNEWMKLGLQGISVVVSTGDTGVAPRNEICARNDTLFATQSPINCPYVTAVGSTVLPPGGTAGVDPETATTSFGSSGGFSNIFGQPSYQADAVDAYFADSPPPYPFYNITLNATHTSGIYNRGGRGYPDVSATGQNFAGFFDGEPTFFAGTSVSAPVFAGIVARINSARLNAGKATVGFLNPTFYQHPEVFNDITAGNNPGCGTNGFTAVKGWDPVTGLGTPNYGLMKDLFLSLP